MTAILPQETDSSKVWILTTIAWEYRPYNLNKAIELNQQALELAKKLKDEEQIGFCFMALGNVYSYHGSVSEALSAYNKALPIFKKLKTPQGKKRLGQVYYNLGILWQEGFGNDSKALNTLLKALTINHKNNHYVGASNCCTKIARILQTQDNATATLTYYKKALYYAKISNDPASETNVINGMSTAYMDWYKDKNIPSYLDSALNGFKKGIKIIKNNEDKVPPQFLPTFLANLGECYFWKREYEKASTILKQSIALSLPISYTSILPNNYSLLGLVAAHQGNQKTATEYLQKAARVSEGLNSEDLVVVLQNLYEAYKQQQKWEEATKWQTKLLIAKDSLSNREKNKTINQMLLQYETEKKNEAIKRLQEEVRTGTKFKILLIALCVFILGTGIAVYRAKQIRYKLLQEKQARLQDREVYLQEHLDRKGRELMIKTVNIEHNNELLGTIKRALDETVHQQPSIDKSLQPTFKLIQKNLNSDKDFEQFSEHFKEVHPNFFQNLSQLSKSPLSTTDLRYCAYMRMHLSAKEMASLLHVEPASVRVAKYRLKIKIGICGQENLEEFIQKI